MNKFITVVTGATFVLTISSTFADASEIGKASKVTRTVQVVTGTRSARAVTGTKIYTLQTVITGQKSAAQFLMNDATNLAVGPNSRLKLDKFVYNPNPSKRRLALTNAKGMLRFVTGTSPSRTYSIKTPVATIGIRGTMLDIFVDSDGLTVIALLKGKIRACRKGCLSLARPGYFLTVTPKGIMFISPTPGGRLKNKASFAQAFPFLAGGYSLDGKLATPPGIKEKIFGRVGSAPSQDGVKPGYFRRGDSIYNFSNGKPRLKDPVGNNSPGSTPPPGGGTYYPGTSGYPGGTGVTFGYPSYTTYPGH